MAGFTDTYVDTVGDGVFRSGYTEAPAAVYLAYSSSASTECTDTGYVRKAVTLSAFSSGITANTAAVTFDAQDSSGDVVECALFDAESAGNQMTDWKALTGGTENLTAGQQFRVPIGDYDLDMSGGS